MGLLIELTRKDTTNPPDEVRQAELAAYFTRCELQPAHLMLVLDLAMTRAFKLKAFIAAASFAQRLLNMPAVNAPAQAKLKAKAGKVLRKSEQAARNEQKLDFDGQLGFRVCCVSLKPVRQGVASVSCPCCGAVALEASAGKLCPVCTLSPLGVETLGLICSMDR